MKKTIALLMVLLLASFSGCVEGPEESAMKENEAGDATMTHLRIGYQPSTHQIAEMVAMEKGWWKEDLAEFGITKVSDSEFPSGPPEMVAMMGGHLDIAYVGAAPPITAIAQGLDAKIVAAVQTQGSDLVLKPEINYTTPSDLSGLTIATFPPGSIQDTVFRKFLMDNGVSFETDGKKVSLLESFFNALKKIFGGKSDDRSDYVVIKEMGPGDAMAAITAGAVDGVFLPHPGPAVIEMEGNGRSVVGSGEMWQDHACCCLLVSGELIREHPEMVKQIIRTHINATEYLKGNQNESAEVFANKTGYDLDKVKYSFETWDGAWISDPRLEINSTLEFAKVQYDLGNIDTMLTKEDLFDTRFYNEVTGE
ncbi:MAG: sulfonate ABC transporter substrate-binding protein [Candidatus Methanogaster sp.]|uniref:Sulfonate ABC transporter substrate-binding protein n=1 Tax=Candidatus Methanogaster sp. TaxID=3386292 RepID=A0AC61KYI9_9EURY|nr:MAG: sulfonate ABC transporter substrate-binding protein [ANME-2 cluster archaeon]